MVRTERESGAAPRAFLGRPFRSPPSPEARHKRGGVSVDRGEWTVVRNRRRKALREEEEGEDRRRQNQASSNYQTAAFFKPSNNSDVDHNYGYHSRAREHHLLGLNQKRYIRGRSREFRRQDSSYRDGWGYRSVSRSRSRYGWGRNHRASWSGWGRRKQDDVEGDGRLRNGWKCVWNTTEKEFVCSDTSFEQCRRVNGDFLGSDFKRNITKLTKALNDVWFGHFRVRAKVAKFERKDSGGNGRIKDKDGSLKGFEESLKKDDINKSMIPKIVNNNEGPESTEGLRVGDIVVKIGAQQEHDVQNAGKQKGKGFCSTSMDSPVFAIQEKKSKILTRKYCTTSDDVQWAHNGLVATVINGEAIPVVQSRITDAGFNNVEIIPMGADKVFVRSSEGVDVMSIVSSAEELFKLVFSNWMRWDKDVQPYHRGAWVRLYGIPLQAWNVNFFKLCVFECGRFLRADNCSADRDRLDFARVLLATPILDIIKRVEKILVDGALVEITIVEEWGYAMGEDTCLFEEENATEASQSDCEEGHVEPDASPRCSTLLFVIILSSSLVQQVGPGSGVPLCNLFGSCVFGLCGQKEIIAYFEAQ
ncbi:hypothetical protein TSUD_106330 [Trifolium subterraneum]|uniref:Uncharacterized protein n=1 Tax=Trifolium subterraneum TaxID=3900 RepID=A0A2Z6M5D8_TRISU|nr:hypothetical protein TSUD_106330 [Trifolium subterraneum]